MKDMSRPNGSTLEEYHASGKDILGLSPERLEANTILIPGGRRPKGEGGIGPQSRRTKMVFPNMSEPDAWHLHCY